MLASPSMTARDRYQPLRDAVRRAILDQDGALDRVTRQRAFDGAPTAPALDPYVTTVRRHAYRVDDAMVEALRAAGQGDAAIFELTVAAAVGQATRQLDAGLAALAAAAAAPKEP